MGATQSVTNAPIDVVNSVVTEITTTVINKHTTTATGTQSMNFECTDAAFAAATTACSEDTKNRNATIASIAAINAPLALEMAKTKPDSCFLCSITNADQNMNIAISINDIQDNSIANQIKAALKNKVDEAIANKTVGGVGLTDSQVNVAKSFKSYVENKFDTKIVNDTLNQFTFRQEMNSKNQGLANLNQTMVASAVASSIVRNAVASGVDIAAATDVKSTVTSDTKGTDPMSFFGGIGAMISMIIGAIGLIILLVIIAKAMMSGSSSSAAPNIPTPPSTLPSVPSILPNIPTSVPSILPNIPTSVPSILPNIPTSVPSISTATSVLHALK